MFNGSNVYSICTTTTQKEIKMKSKQVTKVLAITVIALTIAASIVATLISAVSIFYPEIISQFNLF